MIDKNNENLSIVKQCKLLYINKSTVYYKPAPESEESLQLMRFIDEQFMRTPFYGSRQMMLHLRRQGFVICRKRVRRLMQLMGLCAIYQKPRTSDPHPQHKIYPYLLRDLAINRPGQVWCSDISVPQQAA